MCENCQQLCNFAVALFQEKTVRTVILAMLDTLKVHFHTVPGMKSILPEEKAVVLFK